MPESFTIREMTEFDREGVILLQELQDIETKLHAGRRPWDKADTRAYCDAVTVRMRTGGGKAFVAEAEGKIVGPWRTPWSATLSGKAYIGCARALWEATSTCRLPPEGEATGATKSSWKKN
jgi:hypothetical protein